MFSNNEEGREESVKMEEEGMLEEMKEAFEFDEGGGFED